MTTDKQGLFPWLVNKHLQLTNAGKPLPELLKGLVHVTTLNDWLLGVVAFANEIGENTAEHRLQLAHLSDKEIISIYELFREPSYVTLINALFFYKINPHCLFKQTLHPEKLISVRVRIGLLHSFIELIQQSVIEILHHRGFNTEHDYLIHGDEIPQGIEMDSRTGFEVLITTAIKQWRLKHLLFPDESVNRCKLTDLFRAYKFWFKPNLLIDAVMALQLQLIVSNNQNEDLDQTFAAQMILLYRHLSTNECLDLYGYFSNKDSCHLMRTLLAGYEGLIIPLLTNNDKEAIHQVYSALECVMHSLRVELQNRHITTASYVRGNHQRLVKPGRRNFQALKRVLDIYCDSKREKNSALEQLFREIGG